MNSFNSTPRSSLARSEPHWKHALCIWRSRTRLYRGTLCARVRRSRRVPESFQELWSIFAPFTADPVGPSLLSPSYIPASLELTYSPRQSRVMPCMKKHDGDKVEDEDIDEVMGQLRFEDDDNDDDNDEDDDDDYDDDDDFEQVFPVTVLIDVRVTSVMLARQWILTDPSSHYRLLCEASRTLELDNLTIVKLCYPNPNFNQETLIQVPGPDISTLQHLTLPGNGSPAIVLTVREDESPQQEQSLVSREPQVADSRAAHISVLFRSVRTD